MSKVGLTLAWLLIETYLVAVAPPIPGASTRRHETEGR
jgi:hypothetical protein